MREGKKVGLFYFSGTGNTKIVVEQLAEELRKKEMQVTIKDIVHMKETEILFPKGEYDLIGIGAPVYGFGTPRLVMDFLNKWKEGKGQSVFLLRTAADFVSVNHNCSGKMISLLEKKNYQVCYDRIVVMGSNWAYEYPKELVKQFLEVSKKKTKHMAMELAENINRRHHPSLIVKLLTFPSHFFEEKLGEKFFSKSLRTTENCVSCGLCEKNCPTKNIKVQGQTVEFFGDCMMCMKCIYSCPTKAIYSKYMNFTILKGGYNIHQIAEEDTIKEEFVTEEHPGKYKHFLPYLKDETL